jgi:ADP-dependent NAD(P)H-hydrate dehydratase / NAD(P)H-hydrate epimerase
MPSPVISRAQMREWEKRTWAAKRTPFEVISRVGHILTAHVRQVTRPGDSILVLAGKGHNGDDARQAVQNLTDREVTLLNVREPVAALAEFKSLLSLPQSLIIDGLFGIGLRGRLAPPWQRLLQAINNSGIPILAVDVPSGLDADTGEIQGEAIRASITLTLGAVKRGLLTAAACPCVGRLELAPDIGLVPCPHTSNLVWTLPEDFQSFPPPRLVDGHKGTFGHTVLVAGSLGYHGAAVLAARGAQRAQPGLITLITLDEVYLPIASQLQSVMVRPWTPQTTLPDTATAVCFGPGLESESVPLALQQWLTQLWRETPLAIVADASGLKWITQGRVSTPAPRVITPHPGEAARLLGIESTAVQADRPGAVIECSKRYGRAWVVLKGHQTAVGRSRGEIAINCSGNPLLAQGGSGDVLAGYLTGLLAQPALQADPATTLRYGVWQHGHAADQLARERPHWTVEDLVDRLGDRRRGAGNLLRPAG